MTSRCNSSTSSNYCTSNSKMTDDAFGINPFHDFDIDRVCSTTFTFNSDISNHFFNLASLKNTTPEYVVLTCYAIFLFKFTGREPDFDVLQNVNVRHGLQLSNIMQKTNNRVRFRLDPCESFSQQIHNISKILTCTMEYPDIPPLYTNHKDSTLSSPFFLELSFGLRSVSIMTKFNLRLLNSTSFSDTHVLMDSPYSINIENDNTQVILNFTLTIQDHLHENNLTCIFNGCSDLLSKTTIETVAHRFHSLCQQLFCTSFDLERQPIYELSILLPTERNILQKLNNGVTTSNVVYCIHQAFIHQALLHPDKLAVTLDNESLTYNQLLVRIQHLTFILINDKNVQSGDIVCQYLDRSIEMVIGIMSIMMSGAIYAPLNTNDPLDRLQALIHQVSSKLLLVNHMSYQHGTMLNVPIVNISDIINSYDSLNDKQIKQLSQVDVTPDSICHIVFTSGSTGIPKAVQIRHRNFMSYMETHIIQSNDIVLQLTSSSFDSHLDEIDGALVRGAQLVLLKPGGHLDFDYMTQTIYDKKVTYVGPVPSWINAVAKFLNENHYAQERVKSVRCWYLGGETLFSSSIIDCLPFVDEQSRFFNLYGPAEITIVATCHEVHREELFRSMSLPIGYPLMGYRIYLLDEYQQPVIPGQPGEIVIGGVGVFGGYYGQSDLTAQVLIDIEGEKCYRTGDLARLDVISGELVFIGRRDYQVKLRGQRIELGEVEETVMKSSMVITGCIVMKFTYDDQEYLVAYVETSSSIVKEDELRDYCRCRLPLYMIPSMFIILERFPLTINGKIDRKALPSPDFVTFISSADDHIVPVNNVEKRVHDLWCSVLHLEDIPMKKSFFALRGSSLLFMKLYNLYRIEFGHAPDIVKCFRHASIIEHAQFLSEMFVSSAVDHHEAWSSLQVDHADASFAQSRIVLDEQIRLHQLIDNNVSIYVIPLLYRVSQGSLSIKRLRRTLQQITLKHAVLRTALRFDSVSGNLTQYIQPDNGREWFAFCTSSIDTEKDKNFLQTILFEEMRNRMYFDLTEGQVCRCHIVRNRSSMNSADDDILSIDDSIIFNFHHVAFDGESERIFLDELKKCYSHEQSLEANDEQTTLKYIDYSIHERQMNMTSAKIYWQKTLLDYNVTKPMNLPFDRKCFPSSIQTGQGLSIEIHFKRHIVEKLVEYAAAFNVTLYHVCLTIYYIFLFKLTGGQRDLIVGTVHVNRYRPELENIIGMFVNSLPMRVRIDPQDTFEQLLSKVSTMIFEAHMYSYLPYQSIIEQIPMGQIHERNLFQTMFTLDELSMASVQLDDTTFIEPLSISCFNDDNVPIGTPVHTVTMFDMTLALEHTAEIHSLRAQFIASTDLFDSDTIVNIAKRFQLIIELLVSSLSVDTKTTTSQSICDLSLILPDEIVQDMHYNLTASASFTQKQVGINNIPFFYQLIEGTLSIERLRQALRLVVLQHSALRTSLVFEDTRDYLMQRIIEPKNDEEELFVFVKSTFNSDPDLRAIIENELCNLSNGHGFRVHIVLHQNNHTNLLQIGDYFIFNFHQIAFDHRSLDIFHRDLCIAYEHQSISTSSNNVIRYLDTINEQQIPMKVSSNFWNEIMFGYNWNHHLILPIDYQQNSDKQHIGYDYTITRKFTDDIVKALIDYASLMDISLLPLLLTCYYVFLFKLTNDETDLCVAMNVDSRYRQQLENVIPLRFELDPRANFKDCVHRVDKLYHKSMEHGHFTYQRILEIFSLQPDIRLNISFHFQIVDSDAQNNNRIYLGDAQLQQFIPISTDNSSYHDTKILSKFDLSLIIKYNQRLNVVTCTFDGSSNLFNKTTIETVAHRFHSLCQQLFCTSFDLEKQSIYELSILLPTERNILQKLNNGVTTSNVTYCIHQAFIHQALLHPDKLAVTLDNESLTYNQLLVRIQHLTFILINDKNVQSGDIVCQYLDRSIEMIIGIMSIMMSGAIYAPLNINDPLDRLQALIHQVNGKLVLVNHMSYQHGTMLSVPIVNISDIINSYDSLNDRQIKQLSQVDVTPDSICHIVFTSGSTGIPKAVQIRHRNFMSYMETHIIQSNDIVLQLASSSFDSHLEEIDGALVRGAQLVLLKPGGHLDFDYMTQTIYDKKVTFVTPVPSWMNALGQFLNENHYAQERVKSVRYWYIGGETLFSSSIINCLPLVDEQSRFYNAYGPSEITIVATCHEVHREELFRSMSLPIGYPLMGYRIYLLDKYQQPVIPGQPGEIVIGGVGVFGGYYGQSDLTAQVLIDIEGEKCYRTGDLARLDVISGELVFIGRRDYQVKLRGQRIELSAIELLIVQSSSNIVNCIVMTEDLNGDNSLVAYVQVKKYTDNENIRDEILSRCSSQLVSYMIPTKWLFVPEFPLNDNGKVDRKKLRETATIVDLPFSNRPIKTLSSIELKLQDIFMRAFGLMFPPDVRTPFGQLGGTSLGAMRALNLIRQEVTKKMDIGLLFTNPSVETLAVALEPIVFIAESEKQEQEKDNEDFSIRPRPSWLIESLGILLLIWQWVWPIFMVVRLQFSFLPMLLVPLIHLIQFPLFLKLFGGPFVRGRDALYSWRYYRLWFLRRQWSLNTYWLAHLVGTPFYNAYLCLCGARISDGAYIYTTHIDAPWLVKVGSCTYISDEVILSSLTYHDCIYELHEISIGSYCSIGTRCVLHDRVDINNGVLIEPLTAVTGRIIGQHQEKSSSHILTHSQSQFQLVAILTALSIHMATLKVSWFATNWLPMYIGLPIGWLMWVILGTIIGLFLLSLVGHVQQNFSHPLNSWEFLHKFWLRHLIVNSFGWYISSALDEMNWFIPVILRWLGVTIGDSDIHVTEIVPLLSVPPNLLTIEYGVTITSFVRFVPYDVTTYGQCVVVGPIKIGRESFIGNTSVLRSGVCLSEKVLIGSFTRVDSTINSAQKGNILFGVPARSMPFISSDADQFYTSMTTKQVTKGIILSDFQSILNEFVNIVLIVICFILSLTITSSFNMFPLLVPIFLLIYSFIISAVYVHLISNEFCVTKHSQSFNEVRMSLRVSLSMSLVHYYDKLIGSFFGGTQWLVVALRQFGVQIDDDVIIEDMRCLEDAHLITIGSHVRLSSTSRIQCHTFEQRCMKFRPIIIGRNCILKPMSLVLPGVTLMGHNRLMPCSVILPHDQLAAHTDWSGSPAKRVIVHHGLEPPQLILAQRRSSLGAYDVIVGRFYDDMLTIYFGDNGWIGWQTGIDLRRPFRPSDNWVKLFFTTFLCKSEVNRVLILGLGGGIFPILIRHYFPSVIIDVVEIDETVIELATDFFGLAEQMTEGHLNIIADDAFNYVNKTIHRYDIIFMDAYSEETMPAHLNTEQFFANMQNILSDLGCLSTNANLPTTDSFYRLTQALSSTFQMNILLAHNNIVENARVIISGSRQNLLSIASYEQAIQEAQRFESNVHLEFSMSRLLSLAYRGPLTENTSFK